MNSHEKNVMLQKRYSALIVLQSDYRKSDFRNIQVLHKLIDPNNKLIIQKRNGDRFPNEFLETQIFDDIIHVVAENVCENSAHNNLFKELYMARFPKVSDYLKKIIRFEKTDKITDLINSLRDPEKAFLVYCLCDLEDEYETLSFLNIYHSFFMEPFQSMQNNFETSIASGKFPGTDDNIIDSPAFNKFSRKLETAILDYLNNGEKTLDKAFNRIISEMLDMEKAGYAYPGNISPIIKKFIITNHNGNSAWLLQVINYLGTGKKYNYKPDIYQLFRDYCISFTYMSLYRSGKAGIPFSKVYLAREVFPESIDAVVETILDMYFMDCFYKMFDISQECVYRDFSWENYTKRTQQDVLVEQIKRLQKENELLKNTNSTLNDKLMLLDNQISEDNRITSLEEYRKNKNLTDEIAKLKDIITNQKDKIDSLENLLSQKETESDEKEEGLVIDMDLLQSKKYLFVGRAQEALPELKRLFPNSVFMQEETKDITGIHVDVVVFLIKYLSHSMYYKVKNAKLYEDAFCINYNGKNINKLLETMQKEIINTEKS